MRTTMTIDDDVFVELREAVHRRRMPMRRLADQVLRAGLRYALAALLEDEEILRKLELRK